MQTTTETSGFVATKSASRLPKATREGQQRNPAVGDGLRLATLVGDGLIFLAVQIAAFYLRLQTRVFDWFLPESAFIAEKPTEAFAAYFAHFLLGTILFLAIGASFRIYSRNAYLRPRFVLGDLFKTCVAWTLGYLLFSLFFKIEPSVSRAFVVLAGALGFVVLATWRMAFNRWIQERGLLFHVQDRLLVIGWTKDTETLWRRSRKGDFRELIVTGTVPVNGTNFALNPPKELPVMGSLHDLDGILAQKQHDAVLLADTDIPPAVLSNVVQTCHREMVRYWAKLNEGFDAVFGSRFVKGGGTIDYPPVKLALNRLANLFVRVLFRIPLNDTTNAFKAYRKECLDGLRPILSPHFNLTVELPLKAIIRGYSYDIMPITWRNRRHGVAKLKIKEMGSRYLFIVLYLWLEKYFSRGDYRKPVAKSASSKD